MVNDPEPPGEAYSSGHSLSNENLEAGLLDAPGGELGGRPTALLPTVRDAVGRLTQASRS